MSNLKSKLGVWVNDPAGVIGHLHDVQAIGFDYVIFRASHKTGDGFIMDSHLAGLASDADSIELGYALWGYVYPELGNQPDVYALALRNAPEALGLILDAEVEWEGAPSAAADALCSGIAQATHHGLAMHLSSFGAPGVHPTLPWGHFGPHCQAWMPQAYIHGDGQGNDITTVFNRTLKQSVAPEMMGKELIVTIDDPRQLAQFKGHCDGVNVWLWAGDGSDPGVLDHLDSWKAAIAAYKA